MTENDGVKAQRTSHAEYRKSKILRVLATTNVDLCSSTSPVPLHHTTIIEALNKNYIHSQGNRQPQREMFETSVPGFCLAGKTWEQRSTEPAIVIASALCARVDRQLQVLSFTVPGYLNPNKCSRGSHLYIRALAGGMRESENSTTQEGTANEIEDGDRHTRAPWWAWVLLAAAVVAVSSAATAFRSMDEVPPLTLAAWRLQLTAMLLFPGAVIQYRKLAPALQIEALQNGLLMLVSGMSLAFHFALWVWGIDHTSLTHALLYVSITPILITTGMWVMNKPLSRGENIGTGIGAIGGLSLAFSGVKEGEVTLVGDLACVIASVAVIAYLSIGRHLRAWMPLFVYAYPVTGSAAGFLTVSAVSFGGASVTSPVLLAAVVLVTVSGYQRERKERERISNI
ncbi:g8075 [Coccomyxa elongata]